jgi:hypothetical protein
MRLLFGVATDEDIKAQINLLGKAFRGRVTNVLNKELNLLRRNGVTGEHLLSPTQHELLAGSPRRLPHSSDTGNYLQRSVLGLKKPKMAAELWGALLAYEFDEVPLGSEYALDILAHMHDVQDATFHDSAYHVLALRTKGLYLMADATYLKRAKRKGHVELLDEWQGPR